MLAQKASGCAIKWTGPATASCVWNTAWRKRVERVAGTRNQVVTRDKGGPKLARPVLHAKRAGRRFRWFSPGKTPEICAVLSYVKIDPQG